MTVGRALAALALAGSLAVPAAAGAPTPLQTTFRTSLLADAKTSSAVKRALRSGAAFVDAKPTFGDLTGDGRTDAVVSVTTGGAAGAIAIYVFSNDGPAGGKLAVVFRSQQLYRATAVVQVAQDARVLVLRLPRYASGDPLCCPARIVERTYAWVAAARTLRPTGSREVGGPQPPRA